jgi:hypothetical protein
VGPRGIAFLCWIAVAGIAAGTASCTNNVCKNVDGPGNEVRIWWKPADVPRGARYRLCVDEFCTDVAPHPIGVRYGDAGPYRTVVARAPHMHAAARFEILDARGRAVSVYTGQADLSGGCFKTATFRATPGGSLAVAAVGHNG